MSDKLFTGLVWLWIIGALFSFGHAWSRSCNLKPDLIGTSLCSVMAGIFWPLHGFIWIMSPDMKWPSIKVEG